MDSVDFDSDIGSGVNAVMALMTGIALLAIGAILTFSGHVGVGIAMMVAGALTVYGVYASDGGEAAKTLVETGLSKILIAIGPMIAILGVVLMLTGNIPWGLGLLIAGIALFAVGEVAENWDLLSTNLVGALANMLIDISPYIALLGAVLLFVPGQQALGIGLIIAGIALFAVGQVAANWELLGQNLTGSLVKIFGKISPYIAVFGLLLAMVPGMMAVGIGMIVAGIAMFAFSVIAPNWDSITQALRGPLGKTLAMIGGFLVVLGLMKSMYELRDMLCKELDELARKGELGAGDLEIAHKLTATIKNIDKIDMMESEGYSGGGDWESDMRGAYGRGSSYARRGSHYVRGHYSRADGAEHLRTQLNDMMRETDDERVREALRRAASLMEN